MTQAEQTITDFLRRASNLEPDEAELLFEEKFPPGSAVRDRATEIWNKFQQNRARLKREPSMAERQSLSAHGIDPMTLVKVGEGGEAFVYKATQDNPRRLVAIKFLGTAVSEGGSERMARQVELLSKVHHPDVAPVYFAGHTKAGRPYFVMEHVDGTDIVRQCENQGWNLETRLRLMIRVCHAVEALHKRGVIHKDLKPTNILVTSDRIPRIIDFGIARMVHANWLDEWIERMLVEPAHTPDYSAPELLEWGEVGFSVDCFSLGRVLLQLIVGELGPISASVEPSAMKPSTDPGKLGFRDAASLRRYLRGDLDAIVVKATAVDPGLRYATAGGIALDLEAFLDRRPVSAQAYSRGYESRLFFQRNRQWVLALSAFLIGLVAMTIFAWRGWRSAEEAQAKQLALLNEQKATIARLQQSERDNQSLFDRLKRSNDTLMGLHRGQQQSRLFATVERWLRWYQDDEEDYVLPSARIRLSYVQKALDAMRQLDTPHPREQELRKVRVALIAEAKKDPLGPDTALRATESTKMPVWDFWELNDRLFLALFELESTGKTTADLDVTGYLSALPPSQDPGLRTVRQTACGSLPVQVELRKLSHSIQQLCK